MNQRNIFVSYSSIDRKSVIPIVNAVREEFRHRALNVTPWIDVDDLIPGMNWDLSITRALADSVGLLVFVTPASMESEWIRREIGAAAASSDRLVIPVILQHVPSLPADLAARQWLDLSRDRSPPAIRQAVSRIADAVVAVTGQGRARPPVSAQEAPSVAAEVANGVRTTTLQESATTKPPESIFVVHGHDHEGLSQVEEFLTELGIKPIILQKIGGASQSLLQKFLSVASDARFAVVILSADDLGASRIQYEEPGISDRALQFRARQNVMLELGFFYGLLGWEQVFVVQCKPSRVFPNFERPSDLDGVVFDTMDATDVWRDALATKLTQAGFCLTRA